jgi:hypothetical protein
MASVSVELLTTAQDAQDSQAFTDMKVSKEPKAKAPREPKAKEPREPKAPKEPKEPKEPKAQESKAPKEPRDAFVMYLGISVLLSALQTLLSTEAVQALFAKYPALKQKVEFHATLKFFEKKDKDVKKGIVDAFKQFIEEHGADVSLMVTGIGYHQGTCALQVSPTIRTIDGSNTIVPWTHDKQNHITIALEEGKNAKDSVFAVMKQEDGGDYPGDFIPFTGPFVIIGHLQPF